MRERMPLLLSMVLNVALAAGLAFFYKTRIERELIVPTAPKRVIQPTAVVKTNVLVRRLNFTWQDIETADYPKFIQNLREIGCPEETIKDIIIADINQLYAIKRITEVVTPDIKWWLSEPDAELRREAREKFKELEAERQALLTKLLGEDWKLVAVRNSPDAPTVGLSDPILGSLAVEAKFTVQDIYARAVLKSRALREDGESDNSPAMVKLRLETREALSKVLTKEQLEEYLLRYSNNATRLRAELRGFGATPDEFRAMFQAVDRVDLRLDALASAEGNHAEEMEKLRTQREEVLKAALSPERYQAYKLNLDPAYQHAREVVAQAGVPEEVLDPVYKILVATSDEQKRIKADEELTPEERDELLASVWQLHQETLKKLLGEEGFGRFEKALAR